jgi:hypothetical protein
MNEEKRAKFIRVAEKRTSELIYRIRLLSRCSNTKSYEYTSVQVDEMFGSIEKELEKCKMMFEIGDPIRNLTFSFSDKSKHYKDSNVIQNSTILSSEDEQSLDTNESFSHLTP